MRNPKDDSPADSTDKGMTFPVHDDESPATDWPDAEPTRGGPSAYSELHGNVRKGQKAPKERD